MSDWLGLAFFILVGIAIFIGLKVLARPQKRTEAEFERRAAEGSGTINAGFNALNELMNPEAAKGREVVTQVKEGRYNKKKREGKGNGTAE
jgi:hypothetical protein